MDKVRWAGGWQVDVPSGLSYTCLWGETEARRAMACGDEGGLQAPLAWETMALSL